MAELRVTVRPSDGKGKPREMMSAEEELASDPVVAPAGPIVSNGSSIAPEVNQQAINPTPPAGATSDAPPPMSQTEVNYSKIQQALSAGYSRDEIAGYMATSLGVNADEADKQIIESVQDKIKKAKAAGYQDNDIKNYLIQNKYDGSIIDSAMKSAAVPKPWKKYEFDPNTKAEDAMDIADLYKNIHGKYSTMGKQVLGVMDEQKGIEARRDINKLNISLAAKLKKDNIDAFINPTSGELMMRDENGMEQEVDSSFLNDLYNSKGELAGAITGGIYGAKAGAKAPGRTKAFAIPAATIFGSMLGAAAGKSADMALNSMIIKEDLEASLYATQMKEAAIFDGVAGVLGAGVIKLGAKGGRGIMRAYDFVVAGNSKGAYRALLDNMNITDAQAKELVEQWEKLNNKVAPGTGPEEKAISVVTSTQQGAEGYARYAAATDPKLATSVISSIDARAKGLTKAIDNIADDNVGALVREDLKTYQKDVKDFYGLVKDQGAKEVDGTDFRFDLEKLAIEPVLNNISKTIADPARRESFIAYAARIENASQDRTFSGLVDLRQAVNDFKYSKVKLSVPDLEALNSVLTRIDGQIGKAAKEYMPNGKKWAADFARAKTEYARMKQLEANTLFKLINRKGATEEGIQKALSKYGTDKDVDVEVFNAIAERLSPKVRAKAEGALIRNMTNKYTLGETTDQQAIHFPALAEALKAVNIATPEGRNTVQAINDIAKVFRNDVNLSKVSGNIAVPKFQSFLTTDPVMRVKYEVASQSFNAIKRFVPGKKANNLALLHKVEKLLQDPMMSKSADDLVNAMPVPQQGEMRSLVKELQVETAKAGPQKQQDFVKMYKQTASGKLAVTEGKLGKGVYLVDRVKNTDPAAKVVGHEVNMSRMATPKDVGALLGREVTDKEMDVFTEVNMPDLHRKLAEKGFLGIKVGDRAVLFPDSVVGTNIPKSMPAKLTKEALVEPAVEQVDEIAGKANALIDKLKSGEISYKDALPQAEELGISIFKRSGSGVGMKNATNKQTNWTYAVKPKKKK